MKKIIVKDYWEQEMEKLRKSRTLVPSLLIIDATDGDVGNQIYIKKKVEDFNSLDWPVIVERPTDAESLKLMLEFAEKNREISCVMVQMPVANKFNFSLDMLPREKDCDGLAPQSLIQPATVRGIMDYLEDCKFPFSGSSAVVLGRSDIVGKPMAKALLDKNMTVSICHSKTRPFDRLYLLQNADLVICAIGQPHVITRSMCLSAFVVDVGISRLDGKIVGDFYENDVFYNKYINEEYTPFSIPVPGGVGLLTRLGLLKNCLDLTRLQIMNQCYGCTQTNTVLG